MEADKIDVTKAKELMVKAKAKIEIAKPVLTALLLP